ncbi:hypothetical protein ET445_05465 [Agromyces protaetiae]|uniref:IPT/TIG domain-containing protein n=1 Tax=Agromyces protaetiae TaxID=2509455 RepID=A0A4P6F9M4_9MICO|nr:hypothetical protein [Agromyces protaetiae]QAY72870.1 hypothetical protein ET445_05465 [Agromyces protaetiae]
MPDAVRIRLRRTALAAVAAAALVAAPLAAAPALAAASITVTNAQGQATADPDYATEMTISGSGFQSIPKGFGGVYVLFGWVENPSSGSWRPSNGGQTGSDYRYVPDSESKDNQGFQRFVSFPGSDTEAAAQAIMSADGSFTVDMVIPGATFTSLDRNGEPSEVDCREETCGIITIGAHGVKNANNETFTPIRFAAPGSGEAAGGAAAPAPVAAAPGEVRVGTRPQTAEAGSALAFTGKGFTPGEQVVAVLDDGVAAVGPLTAGAGGEVAGVLSLPSDLRAGTHLLTLEGAASGAVASADVTTTAAEGLVTATPAATEEQWPYLVLALAILVAAALVVTSVVTAIVRAVKRRRRRTATDVSAAAAAASTAVLPDPPVIGSRDADPTVPFEVLTTGGDRS